MATDTVEELWTRRAHLEHILDDDRLWRTHTSTKRGVQEGTHIFGVRPSHLLSHFILKMTLQELFLSFYMEN